MAITKVMHMKASGKARMDIHLKHAVNYILQPKKLGDANLAGGINCLPDTAYEQMKSTKQMFGKAGGRQGYHFVLSLKPGEGTPEIMYDIAMRFTEKAFGGGYEAVVAVHTDRNHLHAHIVINSVNMVTGYKFQYHEGDWKYKFQPITNKLCDEYGLHITHAEYSKEPKNMARPQWEREQIFSKWIEQDARFCALNAESMEHFIFLLEKAGFEVKQGKHIAVKVSGMKRFKRLDTISEDFNRENLEAAFKYGEAGLVSPIVHTMSLPVMRKAVLTPYQRKCYTRMYRLRLAEKRRFTYGSAYLYEQIRKMHELQEEYLLVVNYDVKSFGDLYRLKFRLQNVDGELCKAQKELYRDRASQKRSCKTTEDMVFFEASEDDYRDRLEQIKLQKKDNHKKLKAVERCLERDGSLKEAELELRIPVGEMENFTEMYKVKVPKNPYRVVRDTIVVEEIEEDTLCDVVTDALEECTEELAEKAVNKTVGIVPTREDAIVIVLGVDKDYTNKTEEHLKTFDEKVPIISDFDPNIMGVEQVTELEQIAELPNVLKLPSNKADYMRMSVAEKVHCYGFDTKGTDKAFGMVKAYFQSVGMDAGFDDIYEEAKLLTDYCAKEVGSNRLVQKCGR